MKCLSLWQPWATLVVNGSKRVETRSWFMKHRGSLLIQATKFWSADLNLICNREPFWTALGGAFAADRKFDEGEPVEWGNYLPFGAIIGVVDVTGCVPTDNVRVDNTFHGFPKVTPFAAADRTENQIEILTIRDKERAFGDYTGGRWATVLENPVAFEEPVKFPGRQSMFQVPVSVVAEQLRRVGRDVPV